MGLYAERNYRLTLTDFDRYGRLHPASVLGLLQENSSKVGWRHARISCETMIVPYLESQPSL